MQDLFAGRGILAWGTWLRRRALGLPLHQSPLGTGNSSSGFLEAEAIFCMELACSLDGAQRQLLGVRWVGTTQMVLS